MNNITNSHGLENAILKTSKENRTSVIKRASTVARNNPSLFSEYWKGFQTGQLLIKPKSCWASMPLAQSPSLQAHNFILFYFYFLFFYPLQPQTTQSRLQPCHSLRQNGASATLKRCRTLLIGDDAKTTSSTTPLIGNDAKRRLQLRSPTMLRAASQGGLQQRLNNVS